jgi:hypothetical protein
MEPYLGPTQGVHFLKGENDDLKDNVYLKALSFKGALGLAPKMG